MRVQGDEQAEESYSVYIPLLCLSKSQKRSEGKPTWSNPGKGRREEPVLAEL